MTVNYMHFCYETCTVPVSILLLVINVIHIILVLLAIVFNCFVVISLFSMQAKFNKATTLFLMHDCSVNIILSSFYLARFSTRFFDFLTCADFLHNVSLTVCRISTTLFAIAPTQGKIVVKRKIADVCLPILKSAKNN